MFSVSHPGQAGAARAVAGARVPTADDGPDMQGGQHHCHLLVSQFALYPPSLAQSLTCYHGVIRVVFFHLSHCEMRERIIIGKDRFSTIFLHSSILFVSHLSIFAVVIPLPFSVVPRARGCTCCWAACRGRCSTTRCATPCCSERS